MRVTLESTCKRAIMPSIFSKFTKKLKSETKKITLLKPAIVPNIYFKEGIKLLIIKKFDLNKNYL